MERSYIYINRLSGRFGAVKGVNKQDLRRSLIKLVEISKSECNINSFAKETKNIINKSSLYLTEDLTQSINNVLSSDETNNEKTRILLTLCRLFQNEYLSIKIIPDYLFATFWNYAEMFTSGVKFSNDYQYFKVI